MVAKNIGEPILRKEDMRFITGKGNYTDDINLRGQAYAYFVRAPMARALITSLDCTAAEEAPGVIAVLTGAHVAEDGLGSLPCGWMVHSKDGSEMKQPPHPPMAADRINYSGEPFAVVIADSLQEARDAAELVEVEFDELEAVVNVADAQSGPQIHPEVPGNTNYDWSLGERDDTLKAIENAAHVTKLSLVNNRLIPNAIEPRAALGDYNSGTDEITLYTTSQNPHLARLVLTAFVQLAPEHKLRIIAPDVGGGFGSKIFIYSEETVVAWAARRLNLPVKWTADRSESFLTDAHGRDHVSEAELAMDENGKFLALRVKRLRIWEHICRLSLRQFQLTSTVHCWQANTRHLTSMSRLTR